MKNIMMAVALAGFAVPMVAMAQGGPHPAHWTRPAEPFTIIGNVHYVGTEGLSAFLITGPKGHVLIDGAMPESAAMIADNIRKLGFKPRDVKYLLINHAHFDHSGGTAELKRLTGAKLIASRADKPDLEAGRTISRPELDAFPAAAVDRVIGDGEVVRLGPIALTAMLTPGHTAGSTSWMTVTGGKRVLFAASMSVAGQKLIGNTDYPGVVGDFRSSFAKLRASKADVFLNFHTEGFGMTKKRADQIAGNADAFVDPGETARRADAAEAGFEVELAKQKSVSGGAG